MRAHALRKLVAAVDLISGTAASGGALWEAHDLAVPWRLDGEREAHTPARHGRTRRAKDGPKQALSRSPPGRRPGLHSRLNPPPAYSLALLPLPPAHTPASLPGLGCAFAALLPSHHQPCIHAQACGSPRMAHVDDGPARSPRRRRPRSQVDEVLLGVGLTPRVHGAGARTHTRPNARARAQMRTCTHLCRAGSKSWCSRTSSEACSASCCM